MEEPEPRLTRARGTNLVRIEVRDKEELNRLRLLKSHKEKSQQMRGHHTCRLTDRAEAAAPSGRVHKRNSTAPYGWRKPHLVGAGRRQLQAHVRLRTTGHSSGPSSPGAQRRSEEHTFELQS